MWFGILAVVLQCGCALFPARSSVHKVSGPVDRISSETISSSDRSVVTSSPSPALDRLIEIEQFLQQENSGSSTTAQVGQRPLGPPPTLSMDDLREIEGHFQQSGFTPGLIAKLKPGRHVCLLTHATVSRTPNSVRHSIEQVAGTIVSVDEDALVLNNAVKLTEGRMMGTPIVSKIPYISRLFKNSGTGREAISIPGEVSIVRSEIQGISQLTSEDLAGLHQTSDSMKMGVDFDYYNVEARSR
ncbi:MAG: hypothetical protein DWH78_04875 [Planctomycetota bacterium]|nr:MAG: hypothetical protein DWH78_04875 [Planctomycetota bacterium]